MTALDESGYRLRLAEDLLARARRQLGVDWAAAALFARAAIENAAKAALACFTNVPRTHEPAGALAAALADRNFPESLRPRAQALAPRLASYGVRRHIELSYGDELRQLLPSELVGEAEAREALAVADDAVNLARDLRATLFGPGSS